MAISWGPWTNHLRIGIEVRNTAFDSYTPHIDVHADFWVQCDSSWNFADNQTLVVSGNRITTSSHGFYNGLRANQTTRVVIKSLADQVQSYSGGPTYTYSARLDGVYLGAGPKHDLSWSLPAKPKRPPSAPGAPVITGITANGADSITWSAPTDIGGSSLDYSWLEIATANFANVVYSNKGAGWSPSRAVSTLAPNTTYFTRAAARNAAGWSPFSKVKSFSTLPFQVAKPTLTDIQPQSATLNWVAPTGGTATGYELQVATDTTFKTLAHSTRSATVWATSKAITGLSPATTYYYRVRANTAHGWGAWSSAATTSTLSGAKVRVNGQWVDATGYIYSGGQWVVATVNKRVNGIWVV
jgi:hypothetical protein